MTWQNEFQQIAKLLIVISLAIYLALTLIATIRTWRHPRPVLPLVYAAAAGIAIYGAANAIRWFPLALLGQGDAYKISKNGLADIGSQRHLFAVLSISATLGCIAFLWNFARSVYMLKQLDHGQLAEYLEWSSLYDGRIFQIIEMFFRFICAALFLKLEYVIAEVAKWEQYQPQQMKTVAGYAIFLYLALLGWTALFHFVAKRKSQPRMARPMLRLHILGLSVSLTLWLLLLKWEEMGQMMTLGYILFLCSTAMIGVLLGAAYNDIRGSFACSPTPTAAAAAADSSASGQVSSP
jgi:hypothetical protein